MKLYDQIMPAEYARNHLPRIAERMESGKRYHITVKEHGGRTNEQNRRLWAMLTDISRQVEWHGQKLHWEDWKHVFSAAIEKQRLVQGLDGGLVVLATRTSDKSKRWMGEMIECMFAFGADNNVAWTDPAIVTLEHYPEARRA